MKLTACAALLLLAACARCLNCDRTPEQSWDQQNLKRLDYGCPTAIYHNNSQGVQVLCPPQ